MEEVQNPTESDRLSKLEDSLSQLTQLVTQLVTEKIRSNPRKVKKVVKSKKTAVKRVRSPKATPQTVENNIADKPTVISLVNQSAKISQSGDSPRRGEKGKQCRSEPFSVIPNRPNLFLKDPIAKSFKQDVLIDKKLSGNISPTPRRSTVQLYEVACNVCGSVHQVTDGMFMIDEDTKEVRYRCDNCIGSQRGE